tara:strand:- start:1047 stop:1805 length:759 start_codon:yes stop_codon:yes gene_type:complete
MKYHKINKFIKSDYYFTILYGKKVFLNFTYDKGHCVKIISKDKSIQKTTTLCYDKSLFGTNLYGTIINNKYFIIEDICYYKHKRFSGTNLEKLKIYSEIFNHYKTLPRHTLTLVMPLIDTNYSTLLDKITKLSFKTYSVVCCKFNEPDYYIINYNQLNHKYFTIKATIKSDIYNLYDNDIFKGHLTVPNYKTSVYLNSLFRHIPENNNLDAIQESDDEFEEEDSTFVYLDKSYKAECNFNKRFNTWDLVNII